MKPPFMYRPARSSDNASISELIKSNLGGMTTLPENPDHLSDRINDSLRSFDPRIRKPGSEVYLFVLEEVATGNIVGTSGILSRVGGFDPFYTYRVKSTLVEYEPLNIHNTLDTLELVKNHKGPSEICSLLLHADYRGHGLGKLLSLSRFCFIKAFPERFDETIIAELRGYIDSRERSPFWEAVGRNFFWNDYSSADVLSGIGDKDFIEALIPQHPIIINLLPKSAREVIGRVHRNSEPAKRILLNDGFLATDEVDIFDAGPIVQANRQELKTWNNTQTAPVRIASKLSGTVQTALLTNTSLDFRAAIARIQVLQDGHAQIEKDTATALDLGNGDPVQFLMN